MIGIYRDPPPEDAHGIGSFTIDAETVSGWDSIVQRGVLNSFAAITRGKDFLRGLISP